MDNYEWTIADADFFIYEKMQSMEQMTLREMLIGCMGSMGFIDTDSVSKFVSNQINTLGAGYMTGMKCDIDIIPDAKCIEFTIPKECVPDAQYDMKFRTRPARILIDFNDTNNTELHPRTEYPVVQARIETLNGYCELTIVKYPDIPNFKIPYFRPNRIQRIVEFNQLVTWDYVRAWLTEYFVLDNYYDWADADLTITPYDDTYRDVCDVWVIETKYPYHMDKYPGSREED